MSVKVIFILLSVSLVVSACGIRKKTVDESTQAADQQTDITRPPVTIGTRRNVQVERNPDETISFEEWRRQQQQQPTPE